MDAAAESAKALAALARLADISNAIVGFHAQQAIEKALKSVLSRRGVPFRRTHALAELIGLIGTRSLDRKRAQQTVTAMLALARQELGLKPT